MNNLIAIILFLGILTWDVHSDFKKWKKGIPVNHKKDLILRMLLLIPSTFFFSINNPTFFVILAAITMQGAWWWELFDGWYNKKRGFKWRFNGGADEDNSRLDDFLQKLSDTKETILKWSLIILTTTAYIITSLL